MRIARVRRRSIGKERTAIRRPMKLIDTFMPLKMLDAKSSARRALSFQVFHEAAYSRLESLALRWAEPPPIAEKLLIRLIRRHYASLSSTGMSSSAAKKASVSAYWA